jgi:hypothetical protein
MATLTEQILALYTKGYTVKRIAEALSTPDKVVLGTTVSNTLQRIKKKAPKTKADKREILAKSANKAVESFVNSQEQDMATYITKSSQKIGVLTVGITQRIAEQLDKATLLNRDEIEALQIKLKFLQVANQMFKGK